MWLAPLRLPRVDTRPPTTALEHGASCSALLHLLAPRSHVTCSDRKFELPFAYEEAGVAKQAMVKVVLCSRCAKKLKLPRTDDRAADGSGSRRRRASDETRLEGSPRRSDRSRRKEALPQRDASRRSASPPQSERRRRDERDGSGGSDGQARRSSSRREG